MNYFRMDGWVKSAVGPAVAGAQIYVCLQPANVAGLPPTPLANIFSDPQGLVPRTQPMLTDGYGHYDFYAQAGVYTVVVGLGGVIQQVYPDQSIGGGSSGGTALALSVNGTPNANQFALNLAGQGSVTVADVGNGTVTITGAASGLILGSIQWTPALSGSVTWIGAGDAPIGTDSGATTALAAPTATSNAAITITGTRYYLGSLLVYGGSAATVKSVATFTRGSDNFSVVAIGMFNNVSWITYPYTITTTACAAFHIPASATTWYAVTGDGAAVTDVDTGISYSSRHVLEIDYTPTSVVFKIDGAVVATNTTHIPATSALGLSTVNNRGAGSSTPVLTVEYLSCNFGTV